MARKRNPENKGLPNRWRFTRNAYYYQVPPGHEKQWDGKKTFRLGKSLTDASIAWANRVGRTEKTETIDQLFDRYLIDVVPFKAAASQVKDRQYALILRPVFGHFKPHELQPHHIYKYVDKRSQKTTVTEGGRSKTIGGKTSARREVALLSHVLTKAVEWGVIHRHPFKGEVRLSGEKNRTRYVEDHEVQAALSLPCNRKRGSVAMVQGYIKLKLLTGMAKSDLLRLKETDLKADGIHNQRHKTAGTTGKKTIYEWTDELKKVIAEIKEVRPIDISPFLFCTRLGEGYYDEKTGAASGWDSMWQRFMNKLIEEKKIEERFTDHDLRAKCASDAESLEHAQKLLAHSDSRTTKRIYRRKPERVKPGKNNF